MAEYIEREALVNSFRSCGASKDLIDAIVYRINLQEAVDAVPVVRCKDCKWLYSEMGNYCCRSHRGLVRICENSFCSYGERKDGDGNG